MFMILFINTKWKLMIKRMDDMSKYQCNKCNCKTMYTEKRGCNTGLFCLSCGKWQRWLSKDELRAFEYSQNRGKRIETNPVDEICDVNIKERLEAFIEYLDQAIDKEYESLPMSAEDAIRKNAYCLALERDKNAILNILAGRDFDNMED